MRTIVGVETKVLYKLVVNPLRDGMIKFKIIE
jgi:hypothetical protein